MNTENRTSAQDRTTYKAEAKWGAEIMAKGFTIVPNIFLSQQHVPVSYTHLTLPTTAYV